MSVTTQAALVKFGDPKLESSLMIWNVPQELLFGPIPKRIYCNRLMIEPLTKVFTCLKQKGLQKELKTWDGCFNIRNIEGTNTFSLHSWGLAIDVNALENPYGGTSKLSNNFINCFKQNGFNWGGDWSGKKDPMHFELAKI